MQQTILIEYPDSIRAAVNLGKEAFETEERRAMAADEDRVLLLLPGRRSRDRIIMFHEMDQGMPAPGAARQAGDYTLPTNLIAANHLWEIRE